jgi:hypothetical protein
MRDGRDPSKDGHELRTVRQWALQRIHETRVAGKGTRHDRADNIKAVEQMVAGNPHYTFGIKRLERLTTSEVLDAVSAMTGCSRDYAYREGVGYISPQSTLYGLELATKLILETARKRGRFVIGTGHPGSLLLFYVELVKLIRAWGGDVVEVAEGTPIPPNFELDYVEGVAVLTDRASLWHTHDSRPMQTILDANGAVDLAGVDHGFVGGAINANVPAVTIMDTNDPAPAVAKRMGAKLVIVPMDDNRLPHDYLPIVETIRDLAALQGAPLPVMAEPVRPEVSLRFSQAERVVREQLGGPEDVQQMVDDFAEAYRDQFMQTRLRGDGQEEQPSDEYAVLASYGILRKALDRFILEEMRYRLPTLSPEELAWFFRRYGALDVCRGVAHQPTARAPQPRPR